MTIKLATSKSLERITEFAAEYFCEAVSLVADGPERFDIFGAKGQKTGAQVRKLHGNRYVLEWS